ncbi:Cu-Zn family superoxide dismutase [Cricetibacter osteomyelitidis]|uniref:Superoxide dismutase [Cu-Zn] n=1 Tax=Cricetibacter osteomyelitidis TaxID=1521931 RepID=A0A4R2T8H8_9PAST|nr:superoxide dismutase family protein [Cricetibacter osteomyelitidis]TCP93488.1 Cu-Zn family superoxide dismutase [Cricetibacter osteomyelitidis]
MKKTLLALTLIAAGVSAITNTALANQPSSDSLQVEVSLLDPVKGDKAIGQITITESAYGLVFTPNLHGLTTGLHGFHVHMNPSCEAKEKDGKLTAGLGAGGHWDPKDTKKHGFPWQDDAHLGDLSALYADAEGNATYPVLAPRLKSLSELQGHSLMIHAGGENHSDHPAPLGGGGARMACGVIK